MKKKRTKGRSTVRYSWLLSLYAFFVRISAQNGDTNNEAQTNEQTKKRPKRKPQVKNIIEHRRFCAILIKSMKY